MLKRFVTVKDEEVGSVLLSFVYFFTLMCGYAILKPLRDEMATAGGVKNVPWLFTATFGVMLVAVPAFSALVSRWPRQRVIPLVYRFFLLNLLAFFVVLKLGVGRDAVARAFFVWVSVYNLFVVSVFWSFMADLFASEQGRRLFGFIAAGGTAGMLVGPFLVKLLAEPLGATNLMLLTAVLLEGSAQCVRLLSRRASEVQSRVVVGEAPVGGGIFAGLRLLFSSPLLLGLGLQMLLYAATSTFLYNQQAHIVDKVASGTNARAAAFADIDFWVQVLTLVLQTVVTGRLIPRFGLGAALAVAPLLTALGFAGLAVVPTLGMLIGFKSLRNASHYSFERPGREILFTSVDRETKYKSKGFIDTVVYRGSDSVSAWMYTGLDTLGLGTTGLALAAVPFAGLWLAVSLWLARHQRASTPASAPALASTVDAAR
ncbi:NTP/NDP exchange transporter [Vitiosangium sp. GDMCC 1.1324]|uniref:NTP/NDP exchange transporter n=1 Tax=Vitiosangium sp. (strain GDMCC 1.1324) TaxID=2138576 RepID=UPI000D3BBAF7|nr:MFS transporter [Vitiosangium sp. GDMCC 1.1324]PTL80063.1 MFS transporter [Vitiosangium sp. GDMCC 1.1324]